MRENFDDFRAMLLKEYNKNNVMKIAIISVLCAIGVAAIVAGIVFCARKCRCGCGDDFCEFEDDFDDDEDLFQE